MTTAIRNLLLVLVFVFLMTNANCAHAQSFDHIETDSAQLYRQAQEELRLIWDDVPGGDIRIELYGHPERVPAELAEPMMARIDTVLNKVRKAWESGPPRFVDEVDYSDGWNVSLNHYPGQRRLIEQLKFSIQYRIHRGDTSHVASDLEGMLQISSAFREEPTVIGRFVEMGAHQLIFSTLQETVIAAGALSPTQAKVLLNELNAQQSHDPYGIAAAHDLERQNMTTWLMNVADDAALRQQFIEDATLSFDAESRSDSIFEVAAFDATEFEGAAMLYDAAQAEMVRLLQIDDLELAERAIEKHFDAIEQGQYGPMTALLYNSHNPITNVKAMMKRHADVVATLESIANDPDGVAVNKNAAYFYRRAFGLRDMLSHEEWAAVEAAADVHWQFVPAAPSWKSYYGNKFAQPNELQADAKLPAEKLRAIVAELEQAAAIKNCEFDDWYSKRHGAYRLDPDYLRPMLDCATIVLVTDHLLKMNHELEDAKQFSSEFIWLAMVNHLAQQGELLASELGMQMMREFHSRFHEAGFESDAETKKMIEQFSPNDPFGFVHAMDRLADSPVHTLNHYPSRSNAAQLRWFQQYIQYQRRSKPPITDLQIEQMLNEQTRAGWDEFKDAMAELTFSLRTLNEELVSIENEKSIEALESRFMEVAQIDLKLSLIPTWVDVFTAPIFAAARGHIAGRDVWERSISQ